MKASSRIITKLVVDVPRRRLYKLLYNMKGPMNVMGYSAVRQQLARVLDSVVDDRQPVVITRNKAPSVVLIALEEYEAMAETLHLLRSPANARRLQKATADAAARRFVRSPRG